MLPDPVRLRAFQDEWVRSHPPDYALHLRIFEAMLEEARLLAGSYGSHPLEGLDKDIYLAEVLRADRTP